MGDESPREQIERRLASAERLLIITHARSDGDAVGSMAALAAAARAAGKSADMLLPDRLPERYAFLLAGETPAWPEEFDKLADRADLIVIVDTCSLGQLDALAESLGPRREKIVVADHHATRDDVGAVQWTDTTAAAAGVMVVELLDALGWPVTPPAAEALLTAIATDTGWFRFANTDGRCLRAAARLIDSGVAPAALYDRVYQSDRPERLRLMTRALESLELRAGGAVAAMVLRRSDFAETRARPDETENIVNEAMRLACVEAAILLAENPDCVRVSLRSRGRVDVSQVARRFGGGGHARAAGLRSDQPLDELKQQLIDACGEAFHGAADRPGPKA